ncbi:MAG: hypothetical protein BWX66_01478 [Deltaproteobacteria bacterium ADurb.Bin058]|nr:MAG: hypothetical protein BWX66_01478 [Deltaproteobacteria bacterium ADurb.Bin058]
MNSGASSQNGEGLIKNASIKKTASEAIDIVRTALESCWAEASFIFATHPLGFLVKAGQLGSKVDKQVYGPWL